MENRDFSSIFFLLKLQQYLKVYVLGRMLENRYFTTEKIFEIREQFIEIFCILTTFFKV